MGEPAILKVFKVKIELIVAAKDRKAAQETVVNMMRESHLYGIAKIVGIEELPSSPP